MVTTNRTTVLLYPFFTLFGKEFISSYSNMIGKSGSLVKLYIGDHNYSKSIEENLLFVNILEECFNFEKHLLQIQSHQNYITDYKLEDGTIVIVFKLDEPFSTALKYLKKSKYSKMYEKENIINFFKYSDYFLLQYSNKNYPVIFYQNDSISNNIKKWKDLNPNNFFKDLVISPFHMFLKSIDLKTMLETIYQADIPENNEFIEKIKLNEEILNYKEEYGNN